MAFVYNLWLFSYACRAGFCPVWHSLWLFLQCVCVLCTAEQWLFFTVTQLMAVLQCVCAVQNRAVTFVHCGTAFGFSPVCDCACVCAVFSTVTQLVAFLQRVCVHCRASQWFFCSVAQLVAFLQCACVCSFSPLLHSLWLFSSVCACVHCRAGQWHPCQDFPCCERRVNARPRSAPPSWSP